MLTTTTTQAVKYHGWTLPAGSTIHATAMTRYHSAGTCSWATVSATTDVVDHAIAVPVEALHAFHGDLVKALEVRDEHL